MKTTPPIRKVLSNKESGISTGRMGWIAHRKWKEAKQLPGTAGSSRGSRSIRCLLYLAGSVFFVARLALEGGRKEERPTPLEIAIAARVLILLILEIHWST